jgi:hypothetical protein
MVASVTSKETKITIRTLIDTSSLSGPEYNIASPRQLQGRPDVLDGTAGNYDFLTVVELAR